MNKLTTKNLMINDWVLVNPSAFPIQVEAIHKNKVGYHVVCHKLNWVRIGLLNPISLTDKILEKNGFKVDAIRNKACYYYDKKVVNDIFHRIDEVVRIEVFAKSAKADETGLILLQIGYPDDCTKKIYMEIRYVHELQHAMRICGIEKEIKL